MVLAADRDDDEDMPFHGLMKIKNGVKTEQDLELKSECETGVDRDLKSEVVVVKEEVVEG